MARQYKQLQEIRQELAARLGFGGAAGAANLNAGILNDALQSAQHQLWEDIDWHHLITLVDKPIGYEQNLLDYPSDCDPDRVLEVGIYDGQIWWPMTRGIELENRDYTDELDRPYRWEMFDQMELHPKSDSTYTIKIRYVRRPGRFTQDGDRASIDDELIKLHALATLKSHYRHPDAGAVGQQYAVLLNKVKARHRGKRVHRRRGSSDTASRIDCTYNRPVNASNNV